MPTEQGSRLGPLVGLMRPVWRAPGGEWRDTEKQARLDELGETELVTLIIDRYCLQRARKLARGGLSITHYPACECSAVLNPPEAVPDA